MYGEQRTAGTYRTALRNSAFSVLTTAELLAQFRLRQAQVGIADPARPEGLEPPID